MRKRNAIWILVIIAVLALAACETEGGLEPGLGGERSEMLARHNTERSDAGVAQLTENAALRQIAQQQAEYMADIGDYTHEDTHGDHVDVRATNVGYNWVTIGENVGYDIDGSDMFAAWLGSAGHYSNIIDPDYTEIGIGVAQSGLWQYWCVVFGDR